MYRNSQKDGLFDQTEETEKTAQGENAYRHKRQRLDSKDVLYLTQNIKNTSKDRFFWLKKVLKTAAQCRKSAKVTLGFNLMSQAKWPDILKLSPLYKSMHHTWSEFALKESAPTVFSCLLDKSEICRSMRGVTVDVKSSLFLKTHFSI